MDFSEALRELKNGHHVVRSGWNGKNMYLGIVYDDGATGIYGPWIYIKAVDGKRYPWNPSQQDLFVNDWGIKQY